MEIVMSADRIFGLVLFAASFALSSEPLARGLLL